MKRKLGALLGVFVLLALVLHACVDSGDGSDFDEDGIRDELEDLNDDFIFDPGELDYVSTDTDLDTLCDGQPESPRFTCTGCDDCNNNGFFEPCLGETDPLNNDTDNDGALDGGDGAPVDNLGVDCSAGNVQLAYGSTLNGKPFPLRPTATPSPAPFPTSTPGATPTPFPFIPTPPPG